MRVRFYLIKDQPQNKEGRIYAAISYKYNRLFINTQIHIEPLYWDNKRQEVKITHPLFFTYNQKLQSIRNKILEVFHSQPLNQDPRITLQIIKEYFSIQTQISLVNLIDLFIENRKKTTKKSYQLIFLNLRNLIEAFSPEIKPAQLDLRFVDLFTEFLLSKNLQNSSIKKIFSSLRIVLNWSFNRYIQPFDISHIKFKLPSDNHSTFALTFNEIKLLANSSLSDPKEQLILDAFVFACFTGLRFSDLKNFSKKFIQENIATIIQQKTGKTAQIVIIDPAKKILDKYSKDKPFESLNQQVALRTLKSIAKKLNLNREIKLDYFIGKEYKTEIKPLYEVISFHTARRSFVTLLASLNINPELIKAITGHRAQKEYEKYNLFSPDHIQELVKNLQGLFVN